MAVVFAAQEELGCRGSAVAAFAVNPTCAIATDVSFALTPDAPAAKCGELGKGPMLGWSPTLDVALTRQLETLAEQAGIPLQHEVMGGDTGTDADSHRRADRASLHSSSVYAYPRRGRRP